MQLSYRHTDNTEGDFIKFVRNGNQVIFEKLVTASTNKVPAFSGKPSPKAETQDYGDFI